MNPVHDGLDLNLLATLDVLLQERSVTRAARVQGVTQSAMSHRLRQLRDLLSDPLFVRTAQGLVPTERAQALMEPLRAALVNVRQAVNSERAFDPKTARKTFVIATSDYVEFLMLPGLMEPLSREAPGIDLRLAPLPPINADLADLLARGGSHGGFDLAFAGPRIEAQAGLRTLRLPADPFVVVARKGHPRVHRSLSLSTFVKERHILIAPNSRPGGVVDELLQQRGLRRDVAVVTRYFTVAPFLAARSDLLLTAPALLIGNMLDVLPLKTFVPPLPLHPTVGHMVWHERSQEDAAHRWFRVFLKEQTEAIAAKLLKHLAMVRPRMKRPKRRAGRVD